jgi:hypothetical protein
MLLQQYTRLPLLFFPMKGNELNIQKYLEENTLMVEWTIWYIMCVPLGHKRKHERQNNGPNHVWSWLSLRAIFQARRVQQHATNVNMNDKTMDQIMSGRGCR